MTLHYLRPAGLAINSINSWALVGKKTSTKTCTSLYVYGNFLLWATDMVVQNGYHSNA